MNDKKTITITMEEYNLLLEKQKQVDELKQENSILSVTVELQDNAIEQSVKDTAKEILTDFYLWIGQDFDDIPNGGFIHIMKEDFKRRMKELYNRYGVEVE